MKNKMGDVRNHLVAMMESLGDAPSKDAAENAALIERAKTTSLLATAYISSVKTEIDALRLADTIGALPQAIEANPGLRLIEGGKQAGRA